MTDWRKYDFVDKGNGRYRLERQTWGFFDWALMLIVVSLMWRFWWVFAILLGVALAALTCTVLAGAALAFVSRHHD